MSPEKYMNDMMNNLFPDQQDWDFGDPPEIEEYERNHPELNNQKIIDEEIPF